MKILISNIGSTSFKFRLFEMGGGDSLRAAMARIAGEKDLIEKLRRGVPRVKTIREDAEEMMRRYGSM